MIFIKRPRKRQLIYFSCRFHFLNIYTHKNFAQKTLQKVLTSILGIDIIHLHIKLGNKLKENLLMNKEEILAKSRSEYDGKSDERELQIFANASKTGMAVGGVLAIIIVMFSRIADIPILGLSAWSVYFAMYGSRHLFHFLKTKERMNLIQAIIGIAFGIVCFIGMIVLGLQK